MKGLKYISYANNTGYATAARSCLKALTQAGIPLTWTPMFDDTDGYRLDTTVTSTPYKELDAVCNKGIEYDSVVIHTTANYYRPIIERERSLGKKVYGYTVWEYSELPANTEHELNMLDGVMVPCEWNREVFRSHGVTVPITVVPHIVPAGNSIPPAAKGRHALSGRMNPRPRPDDLVFYIIGQWSHRKAPGLVLQTYLDTFNHDDNVFLIIKTTSVDMTHYIRPWWRGFRKTLPPVDAAVSKLAEKYPAPARFALVAGEDLEDDAIHALHELADVYVSFARTEGWGLGAFEAASAGNPVIITGYGGQLDYLDPDLCTLIPYHLVPAREPVWGIAPSDGYYWAEPDLSSGKESLKSMYRNYDTERKKAKILADKVNSVFNAELLNRTMLKAISQDSKGPGNTP